MKSHFTTTLIGGALLLLMSNVAFADAHSDGLAFGQSQLSNLSGNVTSPSAQGTPYYTNQPPQSSGFGMGSLVELGVGRINTCKTASSGADGVADQECKAVNFLAKNPQTRAKFTVSPNDPILAGISHTINNAKPGDLLDNGCVQKTTTTPDQHQTEVCNEYLVNKDQMCTMGQVVQVDSQSNYQCDQQFKQTFPVTCQKRLVVTVVPGGDPGNVVNNVATAPGTDTAYDAANQKYTFNVTVPTPDGRVYRGNFFQTNNGFNIVDMSKLISARITNVQMGGWSSAGDSFNAVFVNGSTVWVADYSPHQAATFPTCDDFGNCTPGNPVDPLSLPGPFLYQSLSSCILTGFGCDPHVLDQNAQYDLNWFTADSRGAYRWIRSPGAVSVDIRPWLHNGWNNIITDILISGCGGDCGQANQYVINFELIFNQVQAYDNWVDDCAQWRSAVH
ncbi:hypothetical protein [Ralstonia pseudosolanacearum]|uniref:hypothetical protein n=1 Tax=Ralstonia pseudosolanacearum TaxID=1310165 RepID=UPI003CF2D3BE